jgi:hypothetical protein
MAEKLTGKQFGFGFLAGLAFLTSNFGVWRVAYAPVMSLPVFGAFLGAILAFAVCRFFLARAGVIQRFLVSWPTDPDRMPQPPGWLYLGVFAAWLLAFVLITLCSQSEQSYLPRFFSTRSA